MLSKFFDSLAEKVYALQGSPSSMTFQGRDIPGGIAGARIQAIDDARMGNLLASFSATPLGASLLGYAHDTGVNLILSRDMSTADYGLSGGNMVKLNAIKPDADLMTTLAHELRHVWQERQMGLKPHAVSPDARIAMTRFMEADAFSFGQKYAEDYAEKTGNRAPLDSLLAKDCAVKTGLNDTDRFKACAEMIKKGGGYDAAQLRELDYRATTYDTFKLNSDKDSIAAALGVARKIDGIWPYSPKEGQSANFLSKVSDREIMQLGAPSPMFKDIFDKHRQGYTQAFTKQQAASAVVAPKMAAPAVAAATPPAMRMGGK